MVDQHRLILTAIVVYIENPRDGKRPIPMTIRLCFLISVNGRSEYLSDEHVARYAKDPMLLVDVFGQENHHKDLQLLIQHLVAPADEFLLTGA